MLRATFYIMSCTAKNRLRRRLMRLREPRYLLGAIVGGAYLFFAVFGRSRGRRYLTGRGATPAAFLPALGATGPALAGLALLVAAAVSWLMPFSSGLLDFTTTETEFLFAAPVSRRQLLFYRLVRSQWAVFFGAIIVAVTYPSASIPARVRGLVGMWLILMTCHVFFTGVTMARARLRTGHFVAWLPLAATFGAMAVVLADVGRRIWARPVLTLTDAYHVIGGVATSGLPHLVLVPIIALARPMFAESFVAFFAALPVALAIYAIAIAWVVQADAVPATTADGDALEHEPRPAKRTATYQARSVGWTLALEGRPEAAFAWKGALQTFRTVDRRVLMRGLLIVMWLTIAVSLIGRVRGLAQGLGLFASAGATFVVLMGPQILRLDLRQDLQHLELLKTWPVRPGALVRGEIAWPAILVIGLAWVLGGIGLFLSAAAFSRTRLAWRISAGAAALILAPALVFAQYTIHNATALLFPAWIATGGSRPRGVDAMGQRLIMLGGTLVLLVLAIAPGAIVGGVLWIAFYRFIGPWILIPAALICGGLVALEVLMATELVGSAYERLDLTSIERPE